jgi:hypothetical protein
MQRTPDMRLVCAKCYARLTSEPAPQKTMRLEIVIPRPDSILSPNKRPHHFVKSKAIAQARRDAWIYAHKAWPNIKPPRWKQAVCRILWVMPTRAAHPDRMNMTGWLKPAIDGIVNDWGVCEDDKGVFPEPGEILVTKTFTHDGEIWPRGCVLLCFEERKEATT